MKRRPIVIIIDDNKNWLKKLSEITVTFFDVELELVSDFLEAENRLMDDPTKFDLLITDIYPADESRETKGLNFVDFVNTFKNKPVIVVTAEPKLVGTILKDYKVIAAFEKGKFERMEFIKAISEVIKPRDNQNEIDSGNNPVKPDDSGSFNLA